MLLNYISNDWSVHAVFIVVIGGLIFAAMTYRKIEQCDLRQKQREREKEMLVEHSALVKRINTPAVQ
jgi:hypothetical protein